MSEVAYVENKDGIPRQILARSLPVQWMMSLFLWNPNKLTWCDLRILAGFHRQFVIFELEYRHHAPQVARTVG